LALTLGAALTFALAAPSAPATEGPAPPSAAAPASLPPVRPSGRGGGSMLTVAVVIGVAAVAFAAGLFSAGVILHAHSSSAGTAGEALTYDQALAIATARVQSLGGGGTWGEAVALAVDSPYSETYSEPTESGCQSLTFYIPAFHGSLASGTAPDWVIAYVQNPTETAPPEAILEVVNGTALVLSDYPAGTVCTAGGTVQILSTPVADSPEVMANASAAGGSTFLEGQPNSTVVLGLIAESPWVWEVEYEPCGIVPGDTLAVGTLPTLTVNQYASNGTLDGAPSTGTSTCVSSRPYTIALSASVTGTLSGGFFYNFSVSMSEPLPFANLGVELQNSTGGVILDASDGCFQTSLASCSGPAYGWYVVVALGGVEQSTYPAQYYSPPDQFEPIFGSSVTNLENGETLTLVSQSPLASGDVLTLVGTNGAVVLSSTVI
jgi:hypothetical protein